MVAQQQKRQVVTGKTEMLTGLDWVYRVAWSPDSKNFAVIGSKGTADNKTYSVLVYDAGTRKVTRELPIKKPGSTSGDISFSPDGKYLAAGIGVISLWDAHSWHHAHDIEGPYQRGLVTEGIESLVFSPDSKSLSVSYQAVVWPETITIRTREDVEAWAKKEKEAKKGGTFWDKLGKGELRAFLDTVMTFNAETGTRLFVQAVKMPTPDESARVTGNLAYTRDGRYLLVSRSEQHKLKPGEHGRIRTFLEFRDPKTGRLIREMSGLHVMQITAQSLSPNGKLVATGTETLNKDSALNPYSKEWDVIDNKDPVRVWDVVGGNLVREFGPLRGAVKALAFNPDGSLLLSCQTDLEKKETLWLWDVASGDLVERISTPRSGHEFFGCAISPNGQSIAMPVRDQIYLVNLQQ